ncbi:UTP--glucose-1-phosphate uridylyltransferase [Nymphon striatum]|nr:UTP--glucose-1-phosphate uridylyltransferase [Nymphon striatum]
MNENYSKNLTLELQKAYTYNQKSSSRDNGALPVTPLLQLYDDLLQNSPVFGHHRSPSDTTEFKELTKKDAIGQLDQELDKLLRTTSGIRKEDVEKEFRGFKKLFSNFIHDVGPSVMWNKVQPVPEDSVLQYESLSEPSISSIKAMLDKLVVVKLNGGLGTSMGCTGPKSIIPVRSDLTFLDLTVQQIEHLNKTYNTNVPLVLMNSFNTDEDTAKVLRKYKGFQVKIFSFNQSRYPRVNRETLMPIANCVDGGYQEAWYPPGHGDFYYSFYESKQLQEFIANGREYCFVSNIDNLGATVDLNILNMLVNPTGNTAPEFVMEVTDKTRADVKGGTLIHYDGNLRLLEFAQVPKEHVDEFKSVKKFKIFNTNNLWIKLKSIERLVQEDCMDLEVITNHKTLNDGLNVIQLETAAGAAMKNFKGALEKTGKELKVILIFTLGLNVPRSRFLPVKKTSDLLVVMSNLYAMKNGNLVMSHKRSFPAVPLVKLGENHFGKVRDFLRRFASIPDVIELDHLTVSGDVTFGKGVELKGTVIIIANHGDRIDIPPGAILENKIVSGNLRILDH